MGYNLNARSGPRRPHQCRRVPEHFRRACANCKWKDHTSSCSVQDEQQGNEVEEEDEEDEEHEEGEEEDKEKDDLNSASSIVQCQLFYISIKQSSRSSVYKLDLFASMLPNSMSFKMLISIFLLEV